MSNQLRSVFNGRVFLFFFFLLGLLLLLMLWRTLSVETETKKKVHSEFSGNFFTPLRREINNGIYLTEECSVWLITFVSVVGESCRTAYHKKIYHWRVQHFLALKANKLIHKYILLWGLLFAFLLLWMLLISLKAEKYSKNKKFSSVFRTFQNQWNG